jgi:arsenate reductase (thioredoxin)
MKQKVLFVCVHNSARSQMAEAFLNEICDDDLEGHSAGLEPGKLNPLAVEAMREIGIDISHKRSQSVFDVFKSGPATAGFAYVVTVCDESSAERCPIFPGGGEAIALEFYRSSRAQRHARGTPGRYAQNPRPDPRPRRDLVQ